MAGGFYKRRRGILEHLEAGRLSLAELGLHDFLCLKAHSLVGDGSMFSPGVWRGSAAAVAACCPRDIGNLKRASRERAIRRALGRLEAGGYIKTWKLQQGEHGNFPILISRFRVRDLSGNEYEVNAEKTTDWRTPALEPVREASVTCPRAVRELSVIKEFREVKEKIKPIVEPAAGSTAEGLASPKPENPLDREFLEAGRQVYLYFCEKLGHNPIVYTWTPKRRQMLHQRAREAYGITVGFYPGLTPKGWLERTMEAMRVAVNNFALSDWHQGRDPKTGGKKFVGIEYCFGSPERMQKWLMGGI